MSVPPEEDKIIVYRRNTPRKGVMQQEYFTSFRCVMTVSEEAREDRDSLGIDKMLEDRAFYQLMSVALGMPLGEFQNKLAIVRHTLRHVTPGTVPNLESALKKLDELEAIISNDRYSVTPFIPKGLENVLKALYDG